MGGHAEVSEALAVGQRLLAQVMPPVLRTLAYESSVVCLSCMQFLNSFLARVKNVSKRQGGLDDAAQQQLLMIMQACFILGARTRPVLVASTGLLIRSVSAQSTAHAAASRMGFLPCGCVLVMLLH